MTVIHLDFAHRARLAPTTQAVLAEPGSASPAPDAELAAYAASSDSLFESVGDAVLALMSAQTLPEILSLVVHEWPHLLGVDAAGVALAAHDSGFRFGPGGVAPVPARRVRAWRGGAAGPSIREARGDVPLFGPAAGPIRTVGIVPLDLPEPLGCGVLALGSREVAAPAALAGAERLGFLGEALSRMIARCQTTAY